MVDAIFRECLGEAVVLNWSPGLAPKGKLGKDSKLLGLIAASNWNVNLDTTLAPTLTNPWTGTVLYPGGQTGGYSSNLCPSNISSSSASGGGNLTATTANTIAHELGVHLIAGDWTHWCSDDQVNSIDGVKLTKMNTTTQGSFCDECCDDIKDGIEGTWFPDWD